MSMRINGGTVIVNHYSDHVCVFLMHDFLLEETLYAKHAYEQFSSSIGIIARLIMPTMDDLWIKVSKMTA
jgi:hypothetical protein